MREASAAARSNLLRLVSDTAALHSNQDTTEALACLTGPDNDGKVVRFSKSDFEKRPVHRTHRLFGFGQINHD